MSRRLALLNAFLGRAVRPRLAATTDPVVARREFARFARAFLPAPRGLLPVRAPGTALWWSGPRGTGRTILFLHGGGYIAGSPLTHRGLIGRLAREAGAAVCAPDYPLAPEHPFPAAQRAAREAWEALLAAGHAPSSVALAGDSAGGGLALALLAELCAGGTPPAGAAVFSPWTDLTGSGASLRENAARDPLLPAERFDDLVAFALGGQPADDPRASPLFARFPGCPPVLIQASEAEILRDDARRMAHRLRAEGAEVTLDTWPDPPHAWQIFGDWLPESRDAVASAGRFLAACLTPPP